MQRGQLIVLLRLRLADAEERVIRVFVIGKTVENPLIGGNRVIVIALLKALFADLVLRDDAQRAVGMLVNKLARGRKIGVVLAGHLIDQCHAVLRFA